MFNLDKDLKNVLKMKLQNAINDEFGLKYRISLLSLNQLKTKAANKIYMNKLNSSNLSFPIKFGL